MKDLNDKIFLWHWRKKPKKITEDGKIYAHGLAGLNRQNGHPIKSNIDSMKSQSKFQHNSSRKLKGQFSAPVKTQ